jgi:hypothetical protein
MAGGDKLRALCNGHPNAKVPWPHRPLHEAADTLDELLAALELLQGMDFRLPDNEHGAEIRRRALAAISKATAA